MAPNQFAVILWACLAPVTSSHGGERTNAEHAERVSARSKFYQALLRIEEVRIGEAIELLDAIPEPMRDLEWSFARQRTIGSQVTLEAHDESVNAVDVSPDGRFIASGADDRSIKLWATETGELHRTLVGHRSVVNDVTFSLDSSHLLSASRDGTVALWNVESGELELEFREHKKPVSSVNLGPSGLSVASTTPSELFGVDNLGKALIWDLWTGEVQHRLTGHTNHVHDACFHPSDDLIITAGMELKVWNSRTGRLIQTLQRAHSFHIPSVVFSSSGKLFVSAGDRDKTAVVWDTETFTPLHFLRGHNQFLTDVTLSPDETTIATASADHTVRLWDATTGVHKRTLVGHRNWVRSVDFAPDSRTLVSGGRDGLVKIWSVEEGEENQVYRDEDSHNILAVDVSPDGSRIAGVGLDNVVWIWNANTSQMTHRIEGHEDGLRSVRFSPDGSKLATSDITRGTKLWDASNGELIREVDFSGSCVDFSPDGSQLVIAGDSVQLVDVETGSTVHRLVGHDEHTFVARFSPTGPYVATGSADNTVVLWDASNGQIARRFGPHDFWVNDLTFSPDGSKIATANVGNEGVITVWETSTGEKIAELASRGVHSLCFTKDGRRLVTGADRIGLRNTITIWDAETFEELIQLRGHTGRVNSLVTAPNDDGFFSGSYDGTVRWWSAKPNSLSLER